MYILNSSLEPGAAVTLIKHRTGKRIPFYSADTDSDRGVALKRAIDNSETRDTLLLAAGTFIAPNPGNLGSLPHTLFFVGTSGSEPTLINYDDVNSPGLVVPTAAAESEFRNIVIAKREVGNGGPNDTTAVSIGVQVSSSYCRFNYCRISGSTGLHITGSPTLPVELINTVVAGKVSAILLDTSTSALECTVKSSMIIGEKTDAGEADPVIIVSLNINGGTIVIQGSEIRAQGATGSMTCVSTNSAAAVARLYGTEVAADTSGSATVTYYSANSGGFIGILGAPYESDKISESGGGTVGTAPMMLVPRTISDPDPITNNPSGFPGEIVENTDNSSGNAGLFRRLSDGSGWKKITET